MRMARSSSIVLAAVVLVGCGATEATQVPQAPPPPPAQAPPSAPVADSKLPATLHAFVDEDLREVDGAGFDAVCRELVRRYLFTHTELVVREVAQAGIEVEATLGLCIDYAVTDSRREQLLAALRTMKVESPREMRVRDLAIARAQDSEPDGVVDVSVRE